MRRSICITEPPAARAGELGTWRFHYTTATALPKGAKLKFDLLSSGREIDWQIPKTQVKEKSNIIYAQLEEGEIIKGTEVKTPASPLPQYEFVLPKSVKPGQRISIIIGAPPTAKEKDFREKGNSCQLHIRRRRPFYLYIDPKGKGNYEEPEVFSMDIRGNKLSLIKIFTPSFVAKNKRFDITIRFEDTYGNLTNFAPEDTLIELSYEHLRENLSWKLFVPETGFVVLPNLYFNEAGTYRIQLKNLKNAGCFVSSPIKCFQENDRNLFWGLLHGEAEALDGSDQGESLFRHFRDERVVNFLATSPFEASEQANSESWKSLSQLAVDFNEEDRFATFLGFQYEGEPKTEGMRQILFSKDNKPLLRRKDAKSSSLAKLYKGFAPKEILSIPTMTMAKGFHFDFKEFHPEFERVVEIYNAWGSSEKTKKEGNPFPITGKVLKETSEGSLVEALCQNCRFGFVAGGLEGRGMFKDLDPEEQKHYSPGLTAILCEKLNREALFDALYRRACYATTGPRIIVGFYIAGHPMGSELSSAKKQGLKVNRHISGYVAATSPLASVEIVRNGEVLQTFHPEKEHFDYAYDDMVKLGDVTLQKKGAPPFTFYYLRVTQKDGHMAWSSPIWVDHD